MKLLHFLIITIPVAISLIAIIIYIIMPAIIPVQPVSVEIVGSNLDAVHVGDKFRLYVWVTNPNFFPANFDSASTTFDKNAVEYHYDGCGCCAIEYSFSSMPTQISVPVSCADDIANSTGETNATVKIQYHINGKLYSVSASKIFTIFPKT